MYGVYVVHKQTNQNLTPHAGRAGSGPAARSRRCNEPMNEPVEHNEREDGVMNEKMTSDRHGNPPDNAQGRNA